MPHHKAKQMDTRAASPRERSDKVTATRNNPFSKCTAVASVARHIGIRYPPSITEHLPPPYS